MLESFNDNCKKSGFDPIWFQESIKHKDSWIKIVKEEYMEIYMDALVKVKYH